MNKVKHLLETAQAVRELPPLDTNDVDSLKDWRALCIKLGDAGDNAAQGIKERLIAMGEV